MECEECKGGGRILIRYSSQHPDDDYFTECPECEGRGVLPTPEGYELLIFIRKYL